MLPPIGIYRYKDGKLFLVSEMGYKFARWKSYGHYLGNYADYSNDFAHTSTIPFSNAAEIKKDDQNDVLFVVVRKKGCFERVDLGFSNPEVGYASSGSNMATILSVDDFDSEYSLVKVFNKNKM